MEGRIFFEPEVVNGQPSWFPSSSLHGRNFFRWKYTPQDPSNGAFEVIHADGIT
jgi:hypothetical protein